MNDHTLTYKLGLIDIQGPTASEKRCSIFIDLAGLLGSEYTSEAVNKLKAEWRALGKKGKLDIDAESDYASILAPKSAIVDLAVLLNSLSNNAIDEPVAAAARKSIQKWKQPEPFPWKTGDVFRIKLRENLFAYGQILDKSSHNAPTCVLFSLKTREPSDDIDTILRSPPISILHVHDDHLYDRSWEVIGKGTPVLEPGSGPCGARGAIGCREWDGLETLAKAWHGLQPWNMYYKDDFLDSFLLEGVRRPADAVLLDREQLEKHGISRPEWK